jgi:hypothetical protein
VIKLLFMAVTPLIEAAQDPALNGYLVSDGFAMRRTVSGEGFEDLSDRLLAEAGDPNARLYLPDNKGLALEGFDLASSARLKELLKSRGEEAGNKWFDLGQSALRKVLLEAELGVSSLALEADTYIERAEVIHLRDKRASGAWRGYLIAGVVTEPDIVRDLKDEVTDVLECWDIRVGRDARKRIHFTFPIIRLSEGVGRHVINQAVSTIEAGRTPVIVDPAGYALGVRSKRN